MLYIMQPIRNEILVILAVGEVIWTVLMGLPDLMAYLPYQLLRGIGTRGPWPPRYYNFSIGIRFLLYKSTLYMWAPVDPPATLKCFPTLL